MLVVARQPHRKVDIEIAGLVVCVAGRHVGERTAPAVEGQDQTLANDQERQRKKPNEIFRPNRARAGRGSMPP